MSSSTSDRSPAAARASGVVLRWPTGRGTVWLLVATALGAAGLLGSMADQTTTIGSSSYAAWPAAALVSLLAVHSAGRFVRGGGPASGPGSALPGGDPPGAERFRQRLGGWGSYVAAVGHLFGIVGAVAAVALVVAETAAPGRELLGRLIGVVFLVALVAARVRLPEPRRAVTLVLLTGAVVGLLGLGVHMGTVAAGMTEEARPRAPASAAAVLEATAVLSLVFLPIVRMSLLLPGLPRGRGGAAVRRWGLPLTASAATALGLFLGHAIDRVLDPVSTTGTALAEAVSDCGPLVGLTVRAVTLVLGVVLILMSLDDAQVVGGRMSRTNALPDVFSAPPGQRVGLSGEVLVLLLSVLALLIAPGVQALVAFSAFCFLILFGSLHVGVLRLRRWRWRGRGWVPAVGLAACTLLLFSLPPTIILTGIALISLAVSLRAIFVVWAEPLVPDIVEGLDAGAPGVSSPDVRSAAPTRRAEDAPRDLPSDDGPGRAEHRAEG